MSIIVLGSVNVDLVIRTPSLPSAGETVLGGELYQAAGGKGANQAVCVTKDETWHVNALEVNPVEATAAGDAFNGVLAEILADGFPLAHATQRANIAAGLSVTRGGTQPSLPSRDEIEAAFERYRGLYHCS